MIQYGVSFQIVPKVDSSDEYYIYANVDTWDRTKCIKVRSIMAQVVTIADPPDHAPANDQWVADMVEVASQMIQRVVVPPTKPSFTPGDARWRDTTEKPFLS